MIIPDTMRPVVIDYGAPNLLAVRDMLVPQAAPRELLIKVAFAGVGVWDDGERSGAMAVMLTAAGLNLPELALAPRGCIARSYRSPRRRTRRLFIGIGANWQVRP